MVAQFADDPVNFVIVGDNGPAVAEGAQVFLRDEAGAYGIAELADLKTVAAGPDCLGVVLDDHQLVLVGDLADGFHVSTLAVQMNGD